MGTSRLPRKPEPILLLLARVIASFSILLTLWGPSAFARQNQQETSRTITGTVKDHLGRPVVNATIEWGPFRTKTGRETTKTNMHGAFELAVENVGKDFRLGVHAKGHAPAWVDGRIPQTGKPLRVDFKLPKTRFISGTVYSSSNQPIAGAVVSAETAGYGFISSFSHPIPTTPFPGPLRQVKTDKDGKFRIEDLGDNGLTQKKETCTLKVVAEGFTRHYGDKKFTDNVAIFLRKRAPAKSGVIRFVVVDKDSDLPVRQFTVGKRYTTRVRKIESKSGTYLDDQVAIGRTYQHMIFAVGYQPLAINIQSQAANSMDVTKIELTKSKPVKGRVFDEKTGKPVDGVKIVCAMAGRYFPWAEFDTLHDGFHPLKMVQRGKTDKNGYFEFAEGADPNHLYLYPTSQHCRKIVTPSERGNKDDQGQLKISLPPSATITGFYKRGGKVLPGSQIRLWKYQTSKPEEHWETAVADEKGQFKFEHLAAGTYSIAGYATRKFELRKGEQLKLDLGGDLGQHTLSGKATPFLRIFLRPQIKDWNYTQFETRADADGKYSFSGLKKGDYGVTLMYFSEAAGTLLDAHTSITIDGNQKQEFNQFSRVAK